MAKVSSVLCKREFIRYVEICSTCGESNGLADINVWVGVIKGVRMILGFYDKVMALVSKLIMWLLGL